MRRRGSALLVALAVLAGLVALIAALSGDSSVNTKSQTDRMNSRRAQLMAQSAVQKAADVLTSTSPGKTIISDPWATLGNQGATDYSVGSDSFRVQILDTCSRINLNTADGPTLTALSLTSDQVDSLMDWRETSATPRANGAKDLYYNQLAKPYNTKLAKLGSLDELLQVKGFTPSVLYNGSQAAPLSETTTVDSLSNDLDPTGNPKQDINSMTLLQLTSIGVTSNVANTIVQSAGSFQKIGDVISIQGMDQASAKAILNFCALGPPQANPGLINVNTASKQALEAVPNLDADLASSIVDRQSDGYVGLGDLVDVPGMQLSTLAKVVNLLCVSSRSFLVRVIGFAAGTSWAEEATLVLDAKANVSVVREQVSPFQDPASRWGWPATASQHETIGGVW